jgi:hypothetical protein
MLTGKKYNKNARKISEKQKADLKRWLSEFGDLGGIVLNVTNNEYVGGNQRSDALKEGKLVISERFELPLLSKIRL